MILIFQRWWLIQLLHVNWRLLRCPRTSIWLLTRSLWLFFNQHILWSLIFISAPNFFNRTTTRLIVINNTWLNTIFFKWILAPLNNIFPLVGVVLWDRWFGRRHVEAVLLLHISVQIYFKSIRLFLFMFTNLLVFRWCLIIA